MTKGRLIENPYFNEFLYDVMHNAFQHQKERLNGRYERQMRSSRSAKGFAKSAKLEQRQDILTHLGLHWFMVICNDDFTPANLKTIMQQYQGNRPASSLKEMAAKKLYITSDKQFIHLLNLMADTIHTPAYSFNLELNKIGYAVKKWTKQVDFAAHEKAIESIEHLDLMVKLFNSFTANIVKIPEHFGLLHTDLRILGYLWEYRNVYVPLTKVHHDFAGDLSKKLISRAINDMIGKQFIRGHADYRKNEYTITSMGINVVAQYIKKVLRLNTFQ